MGASGRTHTEKNREPSMQVAHGSIHLCGCKKKGRERSLCVAHGLVFQWKVLSACFCAYVLTPEKGHSTTVGQEPESEALLAARVKREDCSDHTMLYLSFKQELASVFFRSGKNILGFFRNVKLFSSVSPERNPETFQARR